MEYQGPERSNRIPQVIEETILSSWDQKVFQVQKVTRMREDKKSPNKDIRGSIMGPLMSRKIP
jgi:hypothetical protein